MMFQWTLFNKIRKEFKSNKVFYLKCLAWKFPDKSGDEVYL